MTKANIGLGVLSIPFVFMEVGMVPGVILLLVINLIIMCESKFERFESGGWLSGCDQVACLVTNRPLSGGGRYSHLRPAAAAWTVSPRHVPLHHASLYVLFLTLPQTAPLLLETLR